MDNNIVWFQHLDGGVGSVDDRHKLQEEMPPQDTVVSDVEAGHFECQHLPALIFSCPTGHLQVDASDGGGQLPWDDPMDNVMHGG
jgi:hypothetical protein